VDRIPHGYRCGGPLTHVREWPGLLASIEQVLVPTVRRGAIVIMDGSARTRLLAFARRSRFWRISARYLPPPTPDPPSDRVGFRQTQALFRAEAVNCRRTLEALGDFVPCFVTAEYANFLVMPAVSGYLENAPSDEELSITVSAMLLLYIANVLYSS
jgi:hypothetical protein